MATDFKVAICLGRIARFLVIVGKYWSVRDSKYTT